MDGCFPDKQNIFLTSHPIKMIVDGLIFSHVLINRRLEL